MYRLLIVDDEPSIVMGLMMIFSEYQKEEFEIFNCYSSAEALKVASNIAIDIVLTDINMPVMNGIELSKKLAAINERTKFIFLTGYSEFEYIYQVISNPTNQYILKSEDDDHIIATVEKAVRMIKAEVEQAVAKYKIEFEKRKNTSLIKSKTLLRIFNNAKIDNNELKRFKINVNITDEVYIFVGIANFEGSYEYMELIEKLFQIKFILEDKFSKKFNVESFVYSDKQIIWLLQKKNSLEDEIYFKRILEEHQALLGQIGGVSLSIVFTSTPVTLSEIASTYQSLSEYIDNVDLSVPMILDFNQTDTTAITHKYDIILELEKYIERNIGKDLTLTALAEMMHFNASYLSRYYKKVTGRNLSKYIANARISRAKELLQSSDTNINDISLMLGFESASYFCAAFKKATGFSPAEYRGKTIKLAMNRKK
jgi:two-component system, response regulator YesN